MPSIAGCRPSESFTFLTWSLPILRVGRSLAYSGSANGMTVLRPSLPPVSWTTTRMVSLAPGRPAAPAARAVRPRNVGTVRPQATSPEVVRNSRRVGDMADTQEGLTTESQRAQRRQRQRNLNSLICSLFSLWFLLSVFSVTLWFVQSNWNSGNVRTKWHTARTGWLAVYSSGSYGRAGRRRASRR